MKIVILGANSYVGARMYFELSKQYDVTGTYNSNQLSEKFLHLDITSEADIGQFFTEHNPDIIIHVANNASARWCEANPDEAVRLNIASTQSIVDVANEMRAKIIYISSIAALSPEANLYSKTKKESEEIVLGTKAGYLILQPSLILGFSPNTVNDRPFNRLLKNLDQGTEAIYDSGSEFQLTYLRHLCEVVEACIKRNIWNECFVVAIPGVTNRYIVAKDILSLFGVTVKDLRKEIDILPMSQDLSKLTSLNLPTYTYENVIKEIIDEIKTRDRFTL